MVVRSMFVCCFVRQKTAYEMRISDWSSDVCSSDLDDGARLRLPRRAGGPGRRRRRADALRRQSREAGPAAGREHRAGGQGGLLPLVRSAGTCRFPDRKSVVSGKSVSVRLDLGVRRILKKKKKAT